MVLLTSCGALCTVKRAPVRENNLHRHDLAFVSAGISGPNILDHENELRPSPGDDGAIARVQRVRDVVHLKQPKFKTHL